MDSKRIGLISALFWIILSMILVNIDVPYVYRILAGVSLLFLLISIFIAVRSNYKQEGRTLFLDDVKSAMRQAAIFVVIVSAFTYIFFRFISPDVLTDKIESDMEITMKEIQDEGGWEAYVDKYGDENPLLKEKSEEDHLDDLREQKEIFVSAGSAALGSMVALLSISFIYSLLVTLFYRKVLSRLDR